MNELKQISEEEIKEKLNQLINLRWKEKLKWLVNLRWIAILGLFIVITGVRHILNIELPLVSLYLGNFVLVFCNILFFFYYQRLASYDEKDEHFFRKANRFASLQISLDLILLTYLIHFPVVRKIRLFFTLFFIWLLPVFFYQTERLISLLLCLFYF